MAQEFGSAGDLLAELLVVGNDVESARAIAADDGVKAGSTVHLGRFIFGFGEVDGVEIGPGWLGPHAVDKGPVVVEAIPGAVVDFGEAAGGRVLNAFEQGGFISVGFQPKQFVHDAARLDQESEHLLLGSGEGGQVAGQLDGYVLVQLGLDGGGGSSFGRGFGCRAGALTGANGEGK